VFTWDAPYSTALLVHSLVSWQDNHFEFLPTTEGVGNNCVSGVDGIASSLSGAYCQNATTGQVSGSYNRTWKDDRQRLTVHSDAEHFATKLWGFDQRIRFGFHVENERYARELTDRPQIFFFKFTPRPDETEGNSGELDPVGLALTQFSIPQTSFARATGVKYSIFGQDQVSLTSSLTATVGLRVDREDIQAKGKEQFDPAAQSALYADLVATCTDSAHCIDGLNRANLLALAFTSFENIDDLKTEMAGDPRRPRDLDRALRAHQPHQRLLVPAPPALQHRHLQHQPLALPGRQLGSLQGRQDQGLGDAGPPLRPHLPGRAPERDGARPSFFTRIETRFRTGSRSIPPEPSRHRSPPTPTSRWWTGTWRRPTRTSFTLGLERELWQETSLKLTVRQAEVQGSVPGRPTSTTLPATTAAACFSDTGLGREPRARGRASRCSIPGPNTFYADHRPRSGGRSHRRLQRQDRGDPGHRRRQSSPGRGERAASSTSPTAFPTPIC
jgi:hypothetical protein